METQITYIGAKIGAKHKLLHMYIEGTETITFDKKLGKLEQVGSIIKVTKPEEYKYKFVGFAGMSDNIDLDNWRTRDQAARAQLRHLKASTEKVPSYVDQLITKIKDNTPYNQRAAMALYVYDRIKGI